MNDWISDLLTEAYGNEGKRRKLAELLSKYKPGQWSKLMAPVVKDAWVKTLPPSPPPINKELLSEGPPKLGSVYPRNNLLSEALLQILQGR